MPSESTLGEERDHPTTDQGHHAGDQPDCRQLRTALPALVADGQPKHRLRVGQRQQQQHRQYRIVAHLADLQQAAPYEESHCRQERQLQRDHQRQRRTEQPAQARGQPHPGEPDQRTAADTGTAGPVLHRGQQEAGDDRHDKAEQHFVAMPAKPAAKRLPGRQQAEQNGNPGSDGDYREQRAAQEERPEPQTPQRRDCQQHTTINQQHSKPPSLSCASGVAQPDAGHSQASTRSDRGW
ncbi:hypothetical protein D9M70_523060 [compost metagenome]